VIRSAAEKVYPAHILCILCNACMKHCPHSNIVSAKSYGIFCLLPCLDRNSYYLAFSKIFSCLLIACFCPDCVRSLHVRSCLLPFFYLLFYEARRFRSALGLVVLASALLFSRLVMAFPSLNCSSVAPLDKQRYSITERKSRPSSHCVSVTVI